MTCGAYADVSASACTTDDVVAGLSQLSTQFHSFAAFVLVAAVVFVVLFAVTLVLSAVR